MLPRPLCEVACSLNEGVERLAFSVVWVMNLDGTLASNKVGKQLTLKIRFENITNIELRKKMNANVQKAKYQMTCDGGLAAITHGMTSTTRL